MPMNRAVMLTALSVNAVAMLAQPWLVVVLLVCEGLAFGTGCYGRGGRMRATRRRCADFGRMGGAYRVARWEE